MANFRTHVTVAAVGSGMLSTMCLGGELITPRDVMLLTVVGTLGGILPDIDLDHSKPTKMMFTALALVLAFTVVLHGAAIYAIVELWLLGAGVYILVRYLGWRVFASCTVHRGIFHSIVAALFFGFAATALSYTVFAFSPLRAWIVGVFLTLGYVLHLVLDELYSVDFLNQRVKRSFGTAVKLVDYRRVKTSVLMTAAMLLMYGMTPRATGFLTLLRSPQTYQSILDRFFPDGMWFAW
ncbi:hypothetical protein NKDENANG_03620 [Candidatus Entotheonellaceae bacterium PAL068K]